jgi:hypothetical protein
MADFAQIRKHEEKMDSEDHKARVARATLVARKLLATLATEFETIPLGDIEQTDPAHKEMAKKLLKVLLEENIPYSDLDFCFQVAMQAISFPAVMVQESMKESFQRCLTGLFGKPARDVTAQEMDVLLKKADTIEPEKVVSSEVAE